MKPRENVRRQSRLGRTWISLSRWWIIRSLLDAQLQSSPSALLRFGKYSDMTGKQILPATRNSTTVGSSYGTTTLVLRMNSRAACRFRAERLLDGWEDLGLHRQPNRKNDRRSCTINPHKIVDIAKLAAEIMESPKKNIEALCTKPRSGTNNKAAIKIDTYKKLRL